MPSRRDVVRSGAALALPSVTTGCLGFLAEDSGGEGPAESSPPDTSPNTTRRNPATGDPADVDPISVATTELVREPIAHAASLWNGNRLPTDAEYGKTHADRLGSAGPGFAGYFASRHGFAPTRTPQQPPYRVTVGQTGSQRSHAALESESVDIAIPRAEVFSSVASELDVSGLVRHDLFRTGKALTVSTAVYRDGVTSISREELLAVYNGRVTNWEALGGPDREIHLVGTVNDVHPEIFEQTVLENQPQGGADELYGQEHRKVAAVSTRNDTLTRVAIRDIESLRAGGTDDYRILDIEVGGEPRGPGDVGYPGTYPVPLYTKGEPDRREQAFVDALSAEVVQRTILNENDDRLLLLPADT